MQGNFEQIAQQAASLAKENRRVSWDAVTLNVLLVPLMGWGVVDTTDKAQLSKTPMPDEWLQAVASLPDISQDGLKSLASALTRSGFVSVLDALEFVESERAALSASASRKGGNELASGAAMLLARAEQEAPGSIERFAEAARDLATAAAGAASFTIEKAVWFGKGLGAIANVMKDIRKQTSSSKAGQLDQSNQ